MEAVLGRWDLTVRTDRSEYPSWLEVAHEGSRFVGRVGSARPVPAVAFEDGKLTFSLPPQYEAMQGDLRFEAVLQEGQLRGRTWNEEGRELEWTGLRAPELLSGGEVRWGKEIDLLDGPLQAKWHARSEGSPFNWKLTPEGLANLAVGTDLITNEGFGDFKLISEYRYPERSNSGIYLRGRYEVQILDDYGGESTTTSSGAIYGFLTPTTNAASPPNEWQACEITLLGRWVTIVLNGEKVIDNQEIPGITGGALDSDEGSPGKLFLQGDHGPISFRKLVLVPRL